MPAPRISLRWLFGATLFVALAVASLQEPWRRWSPSLAFTITIALLLLAIPASLCGRQRQRAFFLGFALVGWGYFLLAYSPWFERVSRQLLAGPVAEMLCGKLTGSLGDFSHYLGVTHTLSMFLFAYFGAVTAEGLYVWSRRGEPVGGAPKNGRTRRPAVTVFPEPSVRSAR